MFDMWSSVTSKLEAQTQIQTNIQQTNLQNSSSGSIKGEHHRHSMPTCYQSLFYKKWWISKKITRAQGSEHFFIICIKAAFSIIRKQVFFSSSMLANGPVKNNIFSIQQIFHTIR